MKGAPRMSFYAASFSEDHVDSIILQVATSPTIMSHNIEECLCEPLEWSGAVLMVTHSQEVSNKAYVPFSLLIQNFDPVDLETPNKHMLKPLLVTLIKEHNVGALQQSQPIIEKGITSCFFN
jgi:hypothetical protein